MPCSVFLIAFLVPPLHINTAEPHWAIFIPVAQSCSFGRLIHVTGNPSTGYELEFLRNYDLMKTNKMWRQWALCLVEDRYAEGNTLSSGTSSSSSSTITPASIAAETAASRHAAQFAPAPACGRTTAHVAVQMSGVESDASNVYTIDVNPCDALEEQAKKIEPPGPVYESVDPALARTSLEWVRDYVNWMISCGIFPGYAELVLDEARIEQGCGGSSV